MLLFLSSFLSSLREEEGKRRTQGSLPHQTSIPPSASAACAANLLASPGFETSHGAEKIFDDGGEDEDDDDENFALSSRSASATPEASLEQNATSSPEAKKPSTRALPMPLDPPVTTTRRGGPPQKQGLRLRVLTKLPLPGRLLAMRRPKRKS